MITSVGPIADKIDELRGRWCDTFEEMCWRDGQIAMLQHYLRMVVGLQRNELTESQREMQEIFTEQDVDAKRWELKGYEEALDWLKSG